jgi:hypothetical protein
MATKQEELEQQAQLWHRREQEAELRDLGTEWSGEGELGGERDKLRSGGETGEHHERRRQLEVRSVPVEHDEAH